jgi:hypothetical protein
VLHEIKQDGFRVIARKDGERVRLRNCSTFCWPVVLSESQKGVGFLSE